MRWFFGWLAFLVVPQLAHELEVTRELLRDATNQNRAYERMIADYLSGRDGTMVVAEQSGFAPGEAAGELVAGGIGMVATGIDGAIGAVGHLENIAVAVPNTVVQTVAGLEGEAAGAADRGFDLTLDHVRELLQQAKAELQAGVREFGGGLPRVG